MSTCPSTPKTTTCVERTHDNFIRFMALTGIVLVMFIREPIFFESPRLWGEEGRDFFAQAYNFAQDGQWYKGLLITPAGYYCLWTNLAVTSAANLVSLEYVPFVTLIFCLAVQLTPFAVVFWSKSPFWQVPDRKLAAAFIFLFTPSTGEIWLTSTNVHFYFTLIAFVLLLEDAAVNVFRRWCYRAIIVIAGLTGPGSCIFGPLYLLKAYQDKDRQKLINGLILLSCAVLQVLIMFFNRADGVVEHRFTNLTFSPYILSLWTQSLASVFLGHHAALKSADYFILLHEEYLSWFVFALCSVVAVVGMFMFFLAGKISNKDRLIFIGAYFMLSFISYVGALTEAKPMLIMPGNAGRYYFVPNVIMLLLVLINVKRPIRFRSGLAMALLLIAVLLGMSEYRGKTFFNPEWHDWRKEVQLWREKPDHKIEIWPSGWFLDLKRSD